MQDLFDCGTSHMEVSDAVHVMTECKPAPFFEVNCSAIGMVLGALSLTFAEPGAAQENERDKLSDDPTKVVTRLGVRYSDFTTVSGSLAFGPVTKINASVSEDDQWSLGGSYLFRFGIVNAAASRRELSSGVTQTQYSIGTFVPLSVIGIEPGGWQLFPMGGANYTEGEADVFDFYVGETITFETTSKGGYLGLLALKPISADWTIKSAAIVSAGSDDYSGVTVGAGLTFNVTAKDSISIFGSCTDNSFGQRDQLGVSFSH